MDTRISSTVSLIFMIATDGSVRVLAESQWSGQVPDDLEERAESEAREMMRIQKARVAVGELDVVGQGVWENISARPRMGRVVTESVLLSSSTTYG